MHTVNWEYEVRVGILNDTGATVDVLGFECNGIDRLTHELNGILQEVKRCNKHVDVSITRLV